MTFKGTLHKDDNDKWYVIHFQATWNGPLFQSLPIVKDTFDINNPNPIVVLKAGKEVEFIVVDKKYAKLIK
jgi:hypothetical protein